ncbi:hypothetical protein CYMTET_4948 [Cymbomonas tetramitiformis]|uniref:Uncharacterized protein n=1 Tax=Cymbomonas tetramitiformis TaxID=36881 RepID=A0AAE0H060_9CHLO|nr:hypothetical protein CYMTET_4948 [Cymbomonas tetramitiformis]
MEPLEAESDWFRICIQVRTTEQTELCLAVDFSHGSRSILPLVLRPRVTEKEDVRDAQLWRHSTHGHLICKRFEHVNLVLDAAPVLRYVTPMNNSLEPVGDALHDGSEHTMWQPVLWPQCAVSESPGASTQAWCFAPDGGLYALAAPELRLSWSGAPQVEEYGSGKLIITEKTEELAQVWYQLPDLEEEPEPPLPMDAENVPPPEPDEDEDEEEGFNEEERAELAGQAMELKTDDVEVEKYPHPAIDAWGTAPGQAGFTEEAVKHMQWAGLPTVHGTPPTPPAPSTACGGTTELDSPAGTDGAAAPPAAEETSLEAQPHQETVGYLVHPASPVKRMLVVHCTGSGKTLTMIKVLDNFYSDPRPKVAIFPMDPVCKNFYRELGKFSNRYARYFQQRQQDKADGGVLDMRDVLEMKGAYRKGTLMSKFESEWKKKHPSDRLPGAPLRAFRYTLAGGSASKVARGAPVNPLFKIKWDGKNPFSNKVVVMDEMHNLVQPAPHLMKNPHCRRALHRLRDLLRRSPDALSPTDAADAAMLQGVGGQAQTGSRWLPTRPLTAENSIIIGFTGTPLCRSTTDVDDLLSIIKGPEGATANEEGFVSYFNSFPVSVFPAVEPRGVPKTALPDLRWVKLQGRTLSNYDKKRKAGIAPEKLAPYGALSTFYTHTMRPPFLTHVHQDTPSWASKLHAVVRDVAAELQAQPAGKSMVLIHREHGYKALLHCLKAHLHDHVTLGRWPPEERTDRCRGVATCRCDLHRFNDPVSNLHGEDIRVLVVDAKEVSEGESFFAVRHMYMVDVPETWSQYQQRVGRVVRFRGHHALPRAERRVAVHLYMAQHPCPSVESADQTLAHRLAKEMTQFRGKLDWIAGLAVDRALIQTPEDEEDDPSGSTMAVAERLLKGRGLIPPGILDATASTHSSAEVHTSDSEMDNITGALERVQLQELGEGVTGAPGAPLHDAPRRKVDDEIEIVTPSAQATGSPNAAARTPLTELSANEKAPRAGEGGAKADKNQDEAREARRRRASLGPPRREPVGQASSPTSPGKATPEMGNETQEQAPAGSASFTDAASPTLTGSLGGLLPPRSQRRRKLEPAEEVEWVDDDLTSEGSSLGGFLVDDEDSEDEEDDEEPAERNDDDEVEVVGEKRSLSARKPLPRRTRALASSDDGSTTEEEEEDPQGIRLTQDATCLPSRAATPSQVIIEADTSDGSTLPPSALLLQMELDADEERMRQVEQRVPSAFCTKVSLDDDDDETDQEQNEEEEASD